MVTMKVVVVAGVSGNIGHEFARYFSRAQDTRCYGIGRRGGSDLQISYIKADLAARSDAEKAANYIRLDDANELYIIHTIGKFAFEPNGKPNLDIDGDGVDDEVYKSNVTTFMNIESALVNRTHPPLKIAQCCIGSVSDVHQIPIFGSYYKSKNILRSYLRDRPRTGKLENMRGVFINISSCLSPDAKNPGLDKDGRIYRAVSNIDTWLSAKEVVERSIPSIMNDMLDYQEISIIKPNKNFPSDYYKNTDALKRKWITETSPQIE